MRNSILRASFFVVISAVMVLAGCQRASDKRDQQFVLTGQTIIQADTLATYFQPAGQKYYTEQDQTFAFSGDGKSDILVVKADEPEADYEWWLKGSDFLVRTGSVTTGSPLMNRDYAGLIMSSFKAFAGKVDLTSLGAVKKADVKIQGRWYEPYQVELKRQIVVEEEKEDQQPVFEKWAVATYFKGKDNSVIDRVQIEDAASGKTFSSFSYNGKWIAGLNGPVPGKIDIFEGRADSISVTQKIQLIYTLARVK